MLKQMRGFARSWVARAFLIILGILMSVTITQNRTQVFSMLQQMVGGVHGVAAVGGYDISPNEVQRELRNRLEALRQQGRNISQEDAIAHGADQQILQSLIERYAMRAYAEKIGLHVGDAQLSDTIRRMPGLQDQSGRFDEATFERALQERGYSQEQFVDTLRGDVESSMLLQALSDGVRAPRAYGELVLAFQSETRTISVAEAPASVVGEIPQPDATQLNAFYEDNRQNFRVPEYRALSIIYARASDFQQRVQVPEERIRQEFETRRAALSQPEKRSFIRIPATSEAQAREIAGRLNRGETPEAVARAYHATVAALTDKTREEIAEERVRNAVYSMRPGQAQAVQSQLTPWTVIKLQSVRPATQPVYETERQHIRDEIAQGEAHDALATAEQAVEDAKSAGASIVDAARSHGLTVVQVPATDAQGRTPEGQPAEALVDQAELIRTAFQTPQGDSSDFTPSGDADVMVVVDHITPATTKPLAQVEQQVRAGFIARERVRRLQDLGRDISNQAAHGANFSDIVRAHHMTMRASSQPINRQQAAQLPSPQLAAQIFGAQPGAVVTALRVDGGSLLAARVEAVHRADPNAQRDAVEQFRRQMQQSLGESVVEVATATAVQAGNVRHNDALMQQTFHRPSQDTQEQ